MVDAGAADQKIIPALPEQEIVAPDGAQHVVIAAAIEEIVAEGRTLEGVGAAKAKGGAHLGQRIEGRLAGCDFVGFIAQAGVGQLRDDHFGACMVGLGAAKGIGVQRVGQRVLVADRDRAVVFDVDQVGRAGLRPGIPAKADAVVGEPFDGGGQDVGVVEFQGGIVDLAVDVGFGDQKVVARQHAVKLFQPGLEGCGVGQGVGAHPAGIKMGRPDQIGADGGAQVVDGSQTPSTWVSASVRKSPL